MTDFSEENSLLEDVIQSNPWENIRDSQEDKEIQRLMDIYDKIKE